MPGEGKPQDVAREPTQAAMQAAALMVNAITLKFRISGPKIQEWRRRFAYDLDAFAAQAVAASARTDNHGWHDTAGDIAGVAADFYSRQGYDFGPDNLDIIRMLAEFAAQAVAASARQPIERRSATEFTKDAMRGYVAERAKPAASDLERASELMRAIDYEAPDGYCTEAGHEDAVRLIAAAFAEVRRAQWEACRASVLAWPGPTDGEKCAVLCALGDAP